MVDYKNSAPSEIYEAMDNIVDKESFYENELSDAKLDQILKIVQDIHTRLESSSNITINRVQNNYSPKIKRSTSSVDTRKVLPAPSNKEPVAPNPIENRYSLPPRLPPSLPPRPPGALPQAHHNSPPLPPRQNSSSRIYNLKCRDVTLTDAQCREVVEWLNDVKTFIDDSFDEDYVGKDENIERIDSVIGVMNRRGTSTR